MTEAEPGWRAAPLKSVAPEFMVPWRRFLVLLSVAASACVLLDVDGPLRAALVFGFLVLVPGAAIMSFAGKVDALAYAALVVSLSLATSTVLASVAIWTSNYFPEPMFVVTAAACVLLLYAGPWSQVLATPAVGSHARNHDDEDDSSDDEHDDGDSNDEPASHDEHDALEVASQGSPAPIQEDKK